MSTNLMRCADFWVGPPPLRAVRPNWQLRVARSSMPTNLMHCADFWVGPPLRVPRCHSPHLGER